MKVKIKSLEAIKEYAIKNPDNGVSFEVRKSGGIIEVYESKTNDILYQDGDGNVCYKELCEVIHDWKVGDWFKSLITKYDNRKIGEKYQVTRIIENGILINGDGIGCYGIGYNGDNGSKCTVWEKDTIEPCTPPEINYRPDPRTIDPNDWYWVADSIDDLIKRRKNKEYNYISSNMTISPSKTCSYDFYKYCLKATPEEVGQAFEGWE